MCKSLAMTLLSFGLLVGVIAFAAFGQKAPPQPAPVAATATRPATQPATPSAAEAVPPARPPAAAVLTDEQGKPVEGVKLTNADLLAVVRGPLAEVTVTLTFANNTDRVLGGELTFPLPEGATVSGYALEVNGSMVDGVAVDKQQARDIYQTESSRRVDPGLVEHIAGNAFRTRLYPVPAYGSRSARVQYVTHVAATRNGATLSLPTGWGEVDKWTVRVESPDAVIEPAGPFGGRGVAFFRSTHSLVAEGMQKEAPRELAVGLAGLPVRSVSIEKWPRDPEAAAEPISDRPRSPDEPANRPGRHSLARSGLQGTSDRPPAQSSVRAATEQIRRLQQYEYYFLLNDTPPAPPAEQAPEVAADLRTKPVRRVAILWDAGLSRAASDKLRELKLLESLLTGWRGATGDLVVFRNTVEPPVSFDLGTPDGRAKVIAHIGRLTYDGASDLGHVPLPKNVSGLGGNGMVGARQPGGNYDCLLLFTNGMGGFDPSLMPGAEAPVYAFSDDPLANRALLQHICRDTGGRFIDLQDFSGDATHEPWSLLAVDYDPDEVAEVYPAGSVPVEGLGHVTLTGRLLAPSATVTLNYGYGNHVISRQPFTLQMTDAREGALAPQYWANHKVADLSLQPEVNHAELTRIGKHFNLVTPNTSLLVLETVDQYVRYHVVPPRTQPGLYEEFLARTMPFKAQEPPPDEQKFLPALANWDLQMRWWEHPQAFVPSPPVTSGNDQWGQRDEDPREARSSERRANEHHAATVRQFRELAREAIQARRSGDISSARDIYAEAILADPGDAIAAPGLNELADGLGGNATPRGRLAEQAAKRTVESASAFRAALDRSSQDADHGDLAAADEEIDQARAALGGSITAFSANQRKEFEAQLADAKQRVDAARLGAARDARATREKLIEDTRAQRGKGEPRGVNRPDDNHRNVYSGSGGGGASTGLFGGSGGGDSGPNPPPARSTGSTGSPPAGSSGAPQAVSAPKPVTPEPGSPPATSIGGIAPVPSNVVRTWDPSSYMAAIKRVPAGDAYTAYLEQRATFGGSPQFYLDCGNYLEQAGKHALALRVVTNVATFRLADANMLRRAAYRLADLGDRDRAIELFERIVKLLPEQLPAYRDLALALSDRADALAERSHGYGRGDGDRIAADYGRCLELLDHVIAQPLQTGSIAPLCLMDANRVIARAARLEDAGEIPPVAVPLDRQLIRNLECDLRVVMTWDTDESSAALTVREPDGDAVPTSPYATSSGGKIDGATDAYGPVEYCLRTLSPGTYRVQVKLAPRKGADHNGPCTVRVSVYTDFGRASEQRKSLSVRVTDATAVIDIGIVTSRGTGAAERDGAHAALRTHRADVPILNRTTALFVKPDNFQSIETLP